MESGDLAAAVRVLGHDFAADAPDFAGLASDCLQTAVYAAGGMLPQVRIGLARIRPSSGDVVLWGSADHLGAVDFFIARALASLGEEEAARRYAVQAVDLCVRVGNRPWERRSRRLLAELGDAVPTPPARGGLIGRQLATDSVERLLDRAADGAGDVLVIAGPPGSGRTAMADLTTRLGRRAGFEVLRATQLAGRSGRLVWAQLLRAAGAPEVAALVGRRASRPARSGRRGGGV